MSSVAGNEAAVPALLRFADLEAGGITPSHVRRADDGTRIYQLWTVGLIPGIVGAGLVHIDARKRTEPHAHSISEHFSCVVRGRALLWVEGVMIPLGPGDCYTVPASQIHELAASATQECWVFEGTGPLLPTPEEMAADFVNARRPDIDARLAEIDGAFEEAFASELRAS
jgi:mannose-6-phosphate isomerase-like protein (cupin superfamily)